MNRLLEVDNLAQRCHRTADGVGFEQRQQMRRVKKTGGDLMAID